MAKTNIELILEMKDRFSKVLKKADTDSGTTVQKIKQRLSDVRERFVEVGSAVSRNTKAAFSDIKRTMTDSSYRRAGIVVAMRELKQGIEGVKKKFNEAFEEAQKKIPVFGQAVEFLKNPITLGVSGLVGVGTQIKNAADLAMNWQKGMAEINVTAGLSQKELDGLSKKMLEIGSQNVAPLEEVPGAFNKIISAGLDAKTALASLDPTLKAAKAGFVDIETVYKCNELRRSKRHSGGKRHRGRYRQSDNKKRRSYENRH